MDRKHIERFAKNADACVKAVRGLTAKELNTLPKGATGWTIQQIVLHLMDSHLIATERMKRIIAEDNPTIQAYDESLFTQRLEYDKMNVKEAAELFRLNQRLTSDLLRVLPAKAFSRKGNHTERGTLTLAELVKGYADHVEHHMNFVKAKRKLLGKPLKA